MQGLIRDGGKLCIYDPEVKSDQIFRDMSTPKFEWDRPNYNKTESHMLENVEVRQGRLLGHGTMSLDAMALGQQDLPTLLCLQTPTSLHEAKRHPRTSPSDSCIPAFSSQIAGSPTEATDGAHAICVLTEWDCFKSYDYKAMYATMHKPAFIFDGEQTSRWRPVLAHKDGN